MSRIKSLAGWGLGLLWAVLFIGGRLVMELEGLHPALRVTAIVLPALAFAGFLLVAVADLRQGDELERRIQGEALATGFGLSFLLISTLGLVQAAGWANPEDWGFAHVLPLIFIFYLIGLMRAKRRYTCEPE